MTLSRSSKDFGFMLRMVAGVILIFSGSAMGATNFDPLLGTYTGQWNNTTFGSSGGAIIIITLDEPSSMMTISVDMDGNVFGGFDPPVVTTTAAVTGDIVNFLLTGDPTYGDVNGSLTSAGVISGVLTDIPGGFITQVDTTGAIVGGKLDMAYTVHFPQGDPATGTVSALIPEPASLMILSAGGLLLFRKPRF